MTLAALIAPDVSAGRVPASGAKSSTMMQARRRRSKRVGNTVSAGVMIPPAWPAAGIGNDDATPSTRPVRRRASIAAHEPDMPGWSCRTRWTPARDRSTGRGRSPCRHRAPPARMSRGHRQPARTASAQRRLSCRCHSCGGKARVRGSATLQATLRALGSTERVTLDFGVGLLRPATRNGIRRCTIASASSTPASSGVVNSSTASVPAME